MPIVRINIAKSAPPDVVHTVSDVVYKAMIDVANVPKNDKFQIITRHEQDELIYPADGYLGIMYSERIVFIQVTWNAGRSVDVKKAFYKADAGASPKEPACASKTCGSASSMWLAKTGRSTMARCSTPRQRPEAS